MGETKKTLTEAQFFELKKHALEKLLPVIEEIQSELGLRVCMNVAFEDPTPDGDVHAFTFINNMTLDDAGSDDLSISLAQLCKVALTDQFPSFIEGLDVTEALRADTRNLEEPFYVVGARKLPYLNFVPPEKTDKK